MPPRYPKSSYRSPFPEPQSDYNSPSPSNPRRWSEGIDLPQPAFLNENYHHNNSDPPPIPPRPQSQFYDEDYYPTVPSSYPKSGPEVWKFPEPSIPQPFAFESQPSGPSYYESPRLRYDSIYDDRPPLDQYYSEQSSSAYHSQTESRRSSPERYPPDPPERSESSIIEDELARLALESDGIRKFQEGELPEKEEEWHKLASEAARKSLPAKEVQRQSTIFEVIKSEKDYVLDLQLINDVFIQKLLASSPAVITPRAELEKFVEEVFKNVMEIEKIHEAMVAALFRRQRQQHPIIESISDIVLDASLSFQPQYEKYIKHYPFAEGRHRRELKQNQLYRVFIEKCAQDTRTRKRDLITLISRPVTRLPRLALILEHVQKLSPPEHSDVETIPIILGVLQQFVKSTQPGIAAAEAKVKFWNYVDGLQFERGEIIDLDPADETRNLLHAGPLGRYRGRNWEDIEATLLDHYFLMTTSVMKSGVKKNVVASRPIPLDFLRIGSFALPTEYRKESPNAELEGGGGLRGALKRDVKVPVYPFMIFHASLHSQRRYTLAAKSEEARKKWHDQLIDALATRKAQQEANKYFAVQQLSGEFFRSKTVLVPADSQLRRKQDYFTGKVTCAARFSIGGRHFLAVGCALGIFVGYSSQSNTFIKAVALPSVTSLAVIESARQLVVLTSGNLISYPLEELANAVASKSPVPSSAVTRIDARSGAVTFMIVGRLADKPVMCFGVKNFRETSVYTMQIYAGKSSTPTPKKSGTPPWLKPYGTPFYVPRDCTGVTLLKNMIAIASDHALAIVNPVVPSAERKSLSVPDFIHLDPQSVALKARCQANIPIGIVRASTDELLVLFDTFGCYVTKHGVPARNSQFVRWETKINSFVSRHPHVLLFSDTWIEVRHAPSGRFVEVIEGKDIKNLQIAQPDVGALLVAMKGEMDNETGMTEKLTELVETHPLGETSTASDPQWDEWDM